VRKCATHYLSRVFELAALVVKQQRGRERIVRANVTQLRKAARLLDTYEQIWRHLASGIDQILAEETEQR
jgi:hypothetical protein